MDTSKPTHPDRRDFLAQASAVGIAGLLGINPVARGEPPPETTKIRLIHTPAICLAPQYIAEELLRAEGFTDIDYVKTTDPAPDVLGAGLADISMWDVPSMITKVEEGKAVVILAGVHTGCYELFGNDTIRAIRDLRGKTIAVSPLRGGAHVLLASILAYVGIDSRTEVKWLSAPASSDAMRLFVDGKADAFMGFPPEPQELRAKKFGRVIVNTTRDRPWSQYFCCAVSSNQDFVSRHPVATKRALRAILKAADVCASEPQKAASYLVAKGFEPRYEIGLEVLKSLPYSSWRQTNPEDTLRFYSVRLREVGMIRSDPRKIIAQGTDWRFLNELKKELKV